MQAIVYLWITTTKNSIKNLKQHPGKLISYLCILLIMGFTMYSSTLENVGDKTTHRPIEELGAIIFMLFMLILFSTILGSLSSTDTLFEMSDVNFLFVSPTSPKSVLVHGLIKQMGTSFILSVFILFQAATLKNFYGVEVNGLVLLFLAYYVVTIISTLVSMAVYCTTSGDEKKKKLVRAVLYLTIVVVGILILKSVMDNGKNLNAIVLGVNSNAMEWIPFAGWVKAIVFGLITGSYNNILMFSVITIVGIVIMLVLIFTSNNNYYEDVIVATETAFTRLEEAKQGRVSISTSKKQTKFRKTGINRGFGADTIFYRHMLENKRSKVLIFNMTTIVQLVIVTVFTFFLGGEFGIMPIFIFTIYTQVFGCSMGRWCQELLLPYIYMIPESPFKKLMYMISEELLKTTFDGVIIFIVVGIMVKASVLEVLMCILARLGFALVVISQEMASTYIYRGGKSRGIFIILDIIFMTIIELPGIILAVLLASKGTAICLLALGLWSIAISILILFLCRNVLKTKEQISL